MALKAARELFANPENQMKHLCYMYADFDPSVCESIRNYLVKKYYAQQSQFNAISEDRFSGVVHAFVNGGRHHKL
jgi:hypothetical protein